MSKKLVAYFSASGVTAGVAKQLAEAAGADIYEIKPETPYTPADLDWTNKKSRSSVEMSDKSSRPAISGECADFSGKTIVLFATSGGSGFGKTVSELKCSVADSTKIIEGWLLNGKHTVKELTDKINALGI